MKTTNLINFANILPAIASTKTVDAASKNTANDSASIHSHTTNINYPNYFDTACLAYQIMGLGKF